MYRGKHAMKFRAMNFRPAAPERQPKSSRGENPGNARVLPRQIHAPKQARAEVSGNEFPTGRAGATTEIRTRRNTGNAGQVPRQICAPKQARAEVSGNVFTPSRAGATTEIKSR